MIDRPDPSEYNEFYQGYIDKVKNKDVIEFLKVQRRTFSRLLNSLTDDRVHYRYAADKWTVKQVLRHVIDAEIVFASRLHAIAKCPGVTMPGMDQDAYMENTNDATVSFDLLVDEFNNVRKANISMIENLHESGYSNVGVASGFPISVRALLYILAGHAEHHKGILKERYL
ncbi:MAG: DinB family protein [Cyclobacteriaceae bacterium]